ncbi:MAG: stage 0 sporulation family protein [Candidatus Goldiibacteriota bacterium]
MIEIVGIKFREDDRIYYYNPCKMHLEKGEKCLVETSGGSMEADVALANFYMEPDKLYAPVRRVLKYLTDKQELFEQKKKRMEDKAREFCGRRISARKMPMRLVDVQYTDDLKKVVFYFVAENRVDFRELLKDLVKTLRVKIELRQISRREYAKKIGGVGICGRIVCCKNHLSSFHPITIKMAKNQGLPLNPSKISGVCGRLLCCLAYEKYEAPVRPIIVQYDDTPEDINSMIDDGAEVDVNWGADEGGKNG